MISIRTAIASALTVAALCTLGAYASHDAATHTGRATVTRSVADPVYCCDAMAVTLNG